MNKKGNKLSLANLHAWSIDSPSYNLIIISCLIGFESVFILINHFEVSKLFILSGILASAALYFVLFFLYDFTYVWNVNLRIQFNKVNVINLLLYILIWIFVLYILIILPLNLNSNTLLFVNLFLSLPFLLVVFLTWFQIIFNQLPKRSKKEKKKK